MTILALALWTAALAQPPAAEKEEAHAGILERAAPSVVAIRVTRAPEPQTSSREPFARRPEGGVCSGLVVDAAGYIVTSFSNVEGKVRKIAVALPDGTEHEAVLQGYDALLDVALLKIKARDLPTLSYAPVAELQQGQAVYAVGRGPDGRGLSFHPGVLSARDRFAGRMVQTDARINFGNCGGPLVDAQGRVIGVLCKVGPQTAETLGQNSGVGFAALWDKIAEAMPRLKQGVRINSEKKPFLGITFDAETTDPGVRVLDVHPAAAADKAGVKANDVIVELAGESVANPADLRKIMGKQKIGDKIKAKVRRGGETLEMELELGEREAHE